ADVLGWARLVLGLAGGRVARRTVILAGRSDSLAAEHPEKVRQSGAVGGVVTGGLKRGGDPVRGTPFGAAGEPGEGGLSGDFGLDSDFGAAIEAAGLEGPGVARFEPSGDHDGQIEAVARHGLELDGEAAGGAIENGAVEGVTDGDTGPVGPSE